MSTSATCSAPSLATCPAPSLRAAIGHKLRHLPARFRQLRLRTPVYVLAEEGEPLAEDAANVHPFAIGFALVVVLLLLWRVAGRSRRATAPPPVNSALAEAAARRRENQAETSSATPLEPIESLAATVEQIRAYAEDYKYFNAGELLDALREALDKRRSSPFDSDVKAATKQLDALLSDGELEKRIKTVRQASRELNSDEGFEICKEDATMRMGKRLAADSTFTVKIEAVLEGVRPADTLFLWREAHLYPDWFPLITKGVHIDERPPLEALIHAEIETWFTAADLVLHGFGCDCFARDGSMLMCVRSVRQSDVPGATLPVHPSETYKDKMIKATRVKADIDILFEPISATSVRFAFMLSHQLNATRMPAWVADLVLQKGMGQIFSSMKTIAVRMAADDRTCKHVPYVNSPEYQPIAKYIRNKVDGYLKTIKAK